MAEFTRAELIIHNGLVWTCALCKQTAFDPDDITHGPKCPLRLRLNSDTVVVTSVGPWIDYGKHFMYLSDDGVVVDKTLELLIDGEVIRVGDINESGGTCDCCSVSYDIVEKYRRVL